MYQNLSRIQNRTRQLGLLSSRIRRVKICCPLASAEHNTNVPSISTVYKHDGITPRSRRYRFAGRQSRFAERAQTHSTTKNSPQLCQKTKADPVRTHILFFSSPACPVPLPTIQSEWHGHATCSRYSSPATNHCDAACNGVIASSDPSSVHQIFRSAHNSSQQHEARPAELTCRQACCSEPQKQQHKENCKSYHHRAAFWP